MQDVPLLSLVYVDLYDGDSGEVLVAHLVCEVDADNIIIT
jgi:hypothetical protein